MVNSRAPLLSEKGLNCKKCNGAEKGTIWETCSLRAWPNSSEGFLGAAFSETARASIAEITLENTSDAIYET